MGQDARIRYTQMVIKQNFIELLKKQPLNRITVKKICELAGINRATFYKYYADPFDLLEKMEQEMIEELRQYVGKREQKGIQKALIMILEKIKSDSELYMAVASENGDDRFPARIFEICYQYVAMDIRRQFPQLSNTQQEWLYYYMAQGCSGILNCWIRGGMKEPAGSVAEFAEKLLRNSLENL